MSMLNGMFKIKALSSEKQAEFELFYKEMMSSRLLPVMADFTLILLVIGVIYWETMQVISLGADQYWSSVHPLDLVYWLCLICFGVANRLPIIRHKAPLMTYVIATTLMLFAYRNFVLQDGVIDPIFGLFFYSAFIGMNVASIRHILVIQFINITFLSASTFFIASPGNGLIQLVTMLVNWFIFHCLLMSIATAIFSQWMFRNLFAVQFLLNDKNEVLSQTFKILKTTEQQLIQQQKHQALNHMAKGLLHEIINPVNSSSQAISFAKSINEDEDIADALEESLTQHQRISDIVTDLRRFSQSESEQELETVSLESLVSKALKFCHRELEKADVQLTVQIPEEQFIDCHSSALTQVFVNLLLNACDALSYKEPHRESHNGLHKKPRKQSESTNEISITSFEHAEEISICFRDNGSGIKESDLKVITDPFFSDEKTPEKMGLGLSICQTIMRHHHGCMAIDSKVNEWTEVELTLPDHIKITHSPNNAVTEKKSVSPLSEQAYSQSSPNSVL